MDIVTTQEQVAENIKKFNDEVKNYSADNSPLSIGTLVNNIPHYRAWYCIYDEKSKSYLFAPSKYIGYKGINAKIYHQKNTTEMDGRQTESVLGNWYNLISNSHHQYDELSKNLRDFCSKLGKKPNSLFRINILRETTTDDSLEDDIVELIWKIYLGLTKSNKELIKTKINKLKV